ncbi:hypothetical protein DNTS_033240 [Danionella cerebrum]|uniref:Zinc finger-containing ubiquitin peptidase 1 n=1 Tax=Danionella cerebrum TaxID=2873325 RepID=A0A553MPN5_9TELE|nr:hypothetical protein DNTS_033240 [Danionella translucida]
MPVCDICSEELSSEAEMRTHLLLSHMENVMACPLCPLSGVTYDELSFHISTAHIEKDHKKTKVKAQKYGRISPDHNRAPSLNVNMPQLLSLAKRITAPTNGASTSLTSSAPEPDIEAAAAHPTLKEDHRRESENRLRKSEQECLSSPMKEGSFPCPMCSLVCSDVFLLQEHVEVHLQKQDEAKGDMLYECPMCSLSCSTSSSLQEHVEIHLEYGSSYATGHSSGDLTLAKKLQEDEVHEWREAQTRREAEDFRNLQKQFGLDNSGGYRRQMGRYLDRAVSQGQLLPIDFHVKRAEMLESLSSGVDDGKSKTAGIMEALVGYYQREVSSCAHVWLCAETDHYFSSEGDRGWGCGYRNFQMLLSSLQRLEKYTLLPDSIPSIPRVQALIEEAWAQGADPHGASHFNKRLQGTRAWIGATEIYTVFTSLCVKSRIVDFHKPTGPNDTHPRLFEWVKQYFTHSDCGGARLLPKVMQTALPPLYLQHQGHSRSIVGMEQKSNGNLCLLLFDPGVAPGEMRKVLTQDTAAAIVRRMRKFPSALKHRQYQVVAVEGVLTPEEKQIHILNSRTLCAEKIP